MARAPSFPHLMDQYEPTNLALWEKVKAVARGDSESMTLGNRTINKPTTKFVWPSPPASAWAIKQYNGFGGGWRKTSVFEILEAGGVVVASTEDEQIRLRRLSERGLARKIGENRGSELWEGLPSERSTQNRVLARWKQALQTLDTKNLRKVIEQAVHRTRDYPAKLVKFKARKGSNGKWSVEAVVEYKFPSKIPVQPGRTPLLPSLTLKFEFDPTEALSLIAQAPSPTIGTKKVYENHRITGDYERTIRSVLLGYQPEVVWK